MSSCTPVDGLCRPAITVFARQLLGTVCVLGGNDCPLIEKSRAREVLDRVKSDPTVSMRLMSDADEVPYYRLPSGAVCTELNREEVLNHKRDLDVLQRLGLCPGDTRRARYLYTLLFEQVKTPVGICAHDTPGWEGCPLAYSGAYERIREQGWRAVVWCRSEAEKEQERVRCLETIRREGQIYIRPHHLLCIACGYNGGELRSPRPDDTIFELIQIMREQPGIPIVLIEGTCQVCDCCEGYHPPTHRCVHGGGLIRDYQRDLQVFQRLGMMPGDSMPARELFRMLFERIPSTRLICGYGDGVSRSREWSICGPAEGSVGYAQTRALGWFS